MGYKDSTRKAFIGPRVVLNTISGPGEEYWIRPRKYSSGVSDEIQDLQRSYMRKNRENLKGYKRIEEAMKAQGKTLEDADPLDLVQFGVTSEKGLLETMYRLSLGDGIGEHNLTGDDGKIICDGKALDESNIEFIIHWDQLAREIVTAIQGWNFPLPAGSAPKSATSQNGSSEVSSSQKTPSSQPSTET